MQLSASEVKWKRCWLLVSYSQDTQPADWLADWQDARPERMVVVNEECGRFLRCRKTKEEAWVSWSHLTSHNQAAALALAHRPTSLPHTLFL